jgi:chromosome partitioning protein
MIVSVAAQKGGVGKSSVTLHLSGAFAENSGKVLLCDIDPQHSLSSTFIDDVFSLETTMKDLLLDPDIPAKEAVTHTAFKKIDIIPSNLELGAIEMELREDPDWQYYLDEKLKEIRNDYGLVLIDCPPSLSTFTRLALVASNSVIIPLECSSYSLKSTRFLLNEIGRVRKRANQKLKVLGLVINKFDKSRRIEQDYRDIIREEFGDKVFKTEIGNYVKYTEAVTLKSPINFYKPKSDQAETYRQLLKEIQDSQKTIPAKIEGRDVKWRRRPSKGPLKRILDIFQQFLKRMSR